MDEDNVAQRNPKGRCCEADGVLLKESRIQGQRLDIYPS